MPIEVADEEWGTPVTPVGHASAPGQLIEFEEEEAEQSATDRVALMLGSVTDDERAKVVVSRKIGPQKFAWCDDLSVSDYEQGGTKLIRDNWGPGEYEIRLYGIKPGTNRFLILAKTTITIDKSLNQSPVHQNSELANVLKAMQEQQAAMLKALTEKPVTDPRQDLMQTITMIGAMKEAFGMNGGQKDSIFEIIKSIKAMREVSEELNPPKEKEESDPMMAVLGQFLPVIQTAMQNRQPQPEQPALPAPQPIAAPSPNPIAQPTEETPDVNVLAIIRLKGLFTEVIKLAEAKSPIEPAAELLYEKLPDELMDILPLTTWFDQLKEYTAMMGADVELHRKWLTEVRNRVLEFIAEDEAGEEENTMPTKSSHG